jgi:hypothetical protein
MRKLKATAISVVAALALVLAPASFAAADQLNGQYGSNAKLDDKGLLIAAEPTCSRLSAANASAQEIFLSTGNPKTYSGTAWQDVTCTATTFKLKYGQRALISSTFNAEADCNGVNGQWCKTRALLSGAEGQPLAPEGDSFAFDSAAPGASAVGGTANWQAHSMNRAWERTCWTTTGCTYRFVVQTQMRDATSNMWLDELATSIRVTIGGVAPL